MALIALGVSSSISIYKACEVVRGFEKAQHEVQVIMTPHATRLISPLLFSALTRRRTIVDPFEERSCERIAHIELAKEVSLLCVAPATANVIAKLATGVADDFLSTFYLAVDCPVLLAPAMNQAMFLNDQTQANLRALRAKGVEVIEPGRGYLACGDTGWGRLAEPEDIVTLGLALLKRRQSLKGRTVLITAGPTREYLDSVRFLSNRSSGKMGYALAAEALQRGARTILITGPVALSPLLAAEMVTVESAASMRDEVLRRAAEADVIIMTAAVSDFRFAESRPGKVKKQDMPDAVRLVRNPDILAELGQRKQGQVLVGFAAETEEVVARARRKLQDKGCDLVVANDVSKEDAGFEAEENEVVLVDDCQAVPLEKMSKRVLSRHIWDRIEVLLGQKT